MPIPPSSMTRWRKRIGEEKLGLLLDETIRLAQEGKYINRKNMEQVVVDTTVQEKNITYTTDAKQLYNAIFKVEKLARFTGFQSVNVIYAKPKDNIHGRSICICATI